MINDTQTNIKLGHYHVKLNDKWTIALFEGKCWHLCNSYYPYDKDEFDEIDETPITRSPAPVVHSTDRVEKS